MGRLRKTFFVVTWFHRLRLFVYFKLKQHACSCVSIMMSAINVCCLCQASIRSKNNIALFSTTGIQHKLTDRIVYLLEASGTKSIISHRYHTRMSFPLYMDSIADSCSGLGLSSGLSNCWMCVQCSIITSHIVGRSSIIGGSGGIPLQLNTCANG